jgi:prepilin-type processing-associated H-X9-DG protein
MKTLIQNRRRGLTLVEVVCVTVAILILCALLIPAIDRARESSRRTGCMGNHRQIGLALQQYAMDNSSSFPPASKGTAVSAFCGALTASYLAISTIYQCPSERTAKWGPTFATCTNSYCYVTESSDGKIPLTESNSCSQLLLLDRGYEGTPNPSVVSRTNFLFNASGTNPHRGVGGNMYFVGGHVKWAPGLWPEVSDGTNGYILRPQ